MSPTESLTAVMTAMVYPAAVSYYLLGESPAEHAHNVIEMATWNITRESSGGCYALLIEESASATGRLVDRTYAMSGPGGHLPGVLDSDNVIQVHEMELMVHASALMTFVGGDSVREGTDTMIQHCPPLPFRVCRHPEIREGCELRLARDIALDVVRFLTVSSEGQLLGRLTLDEVVQGTALRGMKNHADQPEHAGVIRSGMKITQGPVAHR